MKSDLKQRLSKLSMYERAILMFCLRAYFNSGNYTNRLPLAEMLPDMAAMFDAAPKVNVFAKLADLQMAVTGDQAKTVKVFDSMTYDPKTRELVTVLNQQADLNALQKIVEG